MKGRKIKIVVATCVGILAITGSIFLFKNIKDKKDKDNEELVYGESVEDIIGVGYYSDNRYIGKVESQEVTGVDKADDKQVKEIFVEVGDTVKKGDKLFSYDTDEMSLKLKQLELELTSIGNSINNANDEMKKLIKEREEASADTKIEYTAQIQGLQAQINQYNYDASAKRLEIDRQKNAIENAVVYSPMDGVVKKINKNNNDNNNYNNYSMDLGYGYGDSGSNHFIEIMAMGDYRIKATANEMKARSLEEGQEMIVRSRIDDTIWRGKITKVDLEHPIENDGYYGEETVTKYPFYVSLDSIDGLMLGQHVYVEIDYGQGEAKEGLWLPEYYIIMENDSYYVWAEDEDGYIEKRELKVGEYDDSLCNYEILSGLSEDDYITFPEDRIKVGMKVTHNIDEAVYEEEPIDDNFDEDGYIDDNYVDEIIKDGENIDDYMDYEPEQSIDMDVDDAVIQKESEEKGGAVD